MFAEELACKLLALIVVRVISSTHKCKLTAATISNAMTVSGSGRTEISCLPTKPYFIATMTYCIPHYLNAKIDR